MRGKRRIGKLSLVTLFVVGLCSCGGGGGGGGSEISSTVSPPSSSPPLPFAENPQPLNSAEPEVESQGGDVNVALFSAESGNQKLEVFFPYGYIVKSQDTTRALTDGGSKKGKVKIAWSHQEVLITMTDPDVYDDNLFIAMELVTGGPLSFSSVSASDGSGGSVTKHNYTYDVFHTFYEVAKDSTTKEATLALDFGTSLLSEGEENSYYFGGWDTFGEGIKYQITVKANDLPDLTINPDYDGDGDGVPDCPLYIRSDGTIEFPTVDKDGNTYTNQCIAYKVSAGSDDSKDHEKTTLKIYDSSASSSPAATPLNNADITSSGYEDTYSPSSTASAGDIGPHIDFIIEQAIGGGSITDAKSYSYNTFGANDEVTVAICVTTDTSATSCKSGADGDTHSAPIANTFKYDTDDGNYAYYYIDSNGNNIRDPDEPTITYDTSNKTIILPSTGGKIFYTVDYTKGSGYGNFEVDIIEDISSSTPKWIKVANLTDSAIKGFVYSSYDTTTLPSCSSGTRMLSFHVYKLFGTKFKSLLGHAPDYSFCLNTPTSG